MSPCDYNLFAKMKEPLRGIRYNTREAIIRAVARSLLDINRSCNRFTGLKRVYYGAVIGMGGYQRIWTVVGYCEQKKAKKK
jgi:hypothetical protein